MKNNLCDIVYFVFLWTFYFFLKRIALEQAAAEILVHSYSLFLQILVRFSLIMSTKGWKRLF